MLLFLEVAIPSIVNFFGLILIYKFRIGVQVSFSRALVIISALFHSLILGLALTLVRFIHLFWFASTVCQKPKPDGMKTTFVFCYIDRHPLFFPTAILSIAGFSVLFSTLSLRFQSAYISEFRLLHRNFLFLKGVCLIGSINVLLWRIVPVLLGSSLLR
jgi:hypothetical protein